MSDVLLVVITIVFFGLAVLLVRACDVIIGPDEDDLLDGPEDVSEVAPPAAESGDETALAGVAS